ncbi:hypothetical protein OEZ85_002206 [Tetradesmus obliquus]|uniref:Uncharacterized protein n=1 Tax=Tetradesmus obliquus TaxID=3088 RepID=A0ABY8U2A0_TETOB|nr:hypothetical protein OEZ85_002206 [Tetradesmus obliquus]
MCRCSRVQCQPHMAWTLKSTRSLSTRSLSTQSPSTQSLSTQSMSTQSLSTQSLSTQSLSTQSPSTQCPRATRQQLQLLLLRSRQPWCQARPRPC